MQQVPRQFASGVTAQRTAQQIGEPRPSGLSEFIGALNKVANVAAPIINDEAQRKVKLDVQEQLTRRWRNLAVSDDATKAGIDAYNMVDAQADFVKTGAEVNKWIEDQYRMGNPVSPEQIDEYRTQQYKALLERHPDQTEDQTISRFLTTQMMQNAPATIATEFKAQQEWQHSQSLKAVGMRIDQKIPEGTEAIQAFYPKLVAASAAMNVSEAEVRKQMLATAGSYAKTGDDRLLTALDSMPEFRGEREALFKLRQEFEKVDYSTNAVTVGNQYALDEAKLFQGEYTPEQFFEAAVSMQKQWGNTVITKDKIEGTMTKYYAQRAKDGEELDLIKYLQMDRGGVPFEHDALFTNNMKGKAPEVLDKFINKGYMDRVQKGEISLLEARVGILRDSATWSEKEQIKLPALQNAIDGFINIDPKSYQGQNLPADVEAGMQAMLKLKPSTLSMYADEKTFAALEMYRDFSQYMDPKSAMIRVREMQDNPKVITDQKGTERAIKNAVTEAFPNSWFGADVPGFQREQLMNEGQRLAMRLYQSGASDPKVAARTAAKLMSAQKTKTFNGTYINASQEELQKMGFAVNSNVNEVEDAFRVWTEKNLPVMQSNSFQEKLKVEDIRFEVHNGLVRAIDSSGQLVSKGARPVSEILKAYRGEKADKLMKEIEASKVKPTAELMSDLIPAMIKVESGGKQGAVSHAGATGVMQIMEATGPEAAALAGVNWSKDRWKNDEAYNRKLGEAYIRHQLNRYNNDLPIALAAYNWGQGNVDSAIRTVKAKGLPVTFNNLMTHGKGVKGQSMPKETRDYIPKVTKRMGGKYGTVYRSRYG